MTKGVYPPAGDGPVVRGGGWTPDLSLFFSNTADSYNGPWAFRLRSSADGSFTPIAGATKADSFVIGASADGQKVFFQNAGQLDPKTTPETENLYVWDRATEAIKLAGVLPDSADSLRTPALDRLLYLFLRLLVSQNGLDRFLGDRAP